LTKPVTYDSNRAQLLFCMTNQHGSCGALPIADEYFGLTGNVQRTGEANRSGYYDRTRVTRVGKLELRVPQGRQGHFWTDVFERYQRSEKALVGAMTDMCVQGVSTRKVKAVTEELCGHEVSASTISRLNGKVDEELNRFAKRQPTDPYPYLILDARYEKVREDGVIAPQAVMIAIGVDWDGRGRR
jgi:putative transposase